MKMPGVFIYRIVALIASARAGFTGMAIIGQRRALLARMVAVPKVVEEMDMMQ